ncbi:bromodomain associated, partial [Cooperia oncophora]
MGSWPSPEEVARQGLRSATGHILENIGFSSVSGDSLNVLTDVMRRFMIELWSRSKLLAEHAGRTEICPDDMNLTFSKLKFSPVEMRDYLLQVGNVGHPKPMCQFPVAHPNMRPLFAPQPSAKELETRPEHIPPYYPAAHPEWTTEGADYLAVMKPSTSVEKKGGPADFPDFSNMDAKSLGLLRRGHEEPSFLDTSKDHSSATGIRSSANLSSLKLQQSGSSDLTVNISSPRKKVKGSGSYKDLHSSYSPLPSPSPLSAHLVKRPEQSTSRSESPSSRVTALPR